MTLKDSIQSDAVSVFLSADEFAETVVYNPHGGGSRTILAVVDREPPSILDNAGNVLSLSFMVYVANSATEGIAATQIDVGGDKLQISAMTGELPRRTCTILKVMDNDNGMLQIAVR